MASLPTTAVGQPCPADGVYVQVLGSGGPAVNRERASTSYLLWVGPQARLLVDIGGGAYHRYGQSEAKLADLSLVALSHFHPDHVSDLPALLWLSTAGRKERLPIVGPSGNDLVPALPVFLSRLFDGTHGAFQVLGTALGAPPRPGVGLRGVGASVSLVSTVVDTSKSTPTTVYVSDDLTVTAIGIPHGDIPTLAYRARTRDVTVVFSSDQNGTSASFLDFARGTNVLVMHLANGAGTTNALHASPATVGRVARSASVGQLILSHIGSFELNAAVAEVKSNYAGPLTVAVDLQCTAVR